MNSRDHVISCIKRGLKHDPRPTDEPFYQAKEEDMLEREWHKIQINMLNNINKLIDIFKKECEDVSGRVHVVKSADEAQQTISSVLTKNRVRRVIKWPMPLFDKWHVERVFAAMDIEDLSPSEEIMLRGDPKKLSELLSRADLGLTGADYGLAESGTLVLRAVPGQGRAFSLLPPVHLAVLDSRNILPGLDELMIRLQLDLKSRKNLESCLSFITGPSKTADIEMNLVHGVHGPRVLHVMIIT